MFELYRPGQSWLHRTPAGVKVVLLAISGTLIFLLDGLGPVLTVLGLMLALYPLAGLSLGTAWAQIRPAFWVLLAIFVAQGLINGWVLGGFITARFASLLLLAGLLTLTTRASDMMAAMERGFWVLKYVGINPAKLSLALSLALRFIPVLASVTAEVREAQKVRGLDRSVLAVAIPVILRLLKMSDDISAAIEARGFNP